MSQKEKFESRRKVICKQPIAIILVRISKDQNQAEGYESKSPHEFWALECPACHKHRKTMLMRQHMRASVTWNPALKASAE